MSQAAAPVHAVVVAYNSSDDLDDCLASLGGKIQVTVVDNSSSAEVLAVATGRGAHYIDARCNVGFAAGVNLALRDFGSEWGRDVLLLNPDALLNLDSIRRMSDFLRRVDNRRVAAVSPRLVSHDGSDQRVEWPFPTPWRVWLDALGLGRTPARRTFVVGAALLLRWEAIAEVGFFDERYFLYAEEADWQKRAQALGWTSVVYAEAIASHRGAGASSDPRRREALFHAGQETYIRKWYGRSGWLIYRIGAFLGAASRAVFLPGDRGREAARRALLYFRGPRGCAGMARDA